MDDSLFSHVLSSLLPPDLVRLVDANVLRPDSPGQVALRAATIAGRRLLSTFGPLVHPVTERALALAREKQGVVDAAVPLVVLVALVLVMNWVRRAVMWCARLAVRAAFWTCAAVLLAWMCQRGLLQSAADLGRLAANVVRYVAILRDVWVDEYRRYEGAQATGRWDEFSHTRRGSTTGRY